MNKSIISKTLGPIHFEDLDPHRFEDLVRELAYDFRDWQSIEATGRGGSDTGFDIRAYERINTEVIESDDDNFTEEMTHPMEGRVWMIQCKREKKIGPAKVISIISEGVNPTTPPYGYILAAPTNFSKASYDKFREELRTRGVMEFYLWGRAALEDMLHLPKNDHILFTFFGISLVSRRKSRATEIRAVISVKNKLLKLLGSQPGYQPVLLRDTKDVHYPYKSEYADFNKNPRWKEYPAVEMHPLGFIVQVRKFFAFRDPIKKEWDYSDAINLVYRQGNDEDRKTNHDLRQNVEGFWEFFQKSHQAMFIVNGLVRFDSIVAIDGEGDLLYEFPHIYIDFQGEQGPFVGFYKYLEFDEYHHESIDGLKKVETFPNTFSKPKFGTIYSDKTIEVSDRVHALLKSRSANVHTIYKCDEKLEFLNPGDVIGVRQSKDHEGNQVLLKITNKRKEPASKFLKRKNIDPILLQDIEKQIGQNLKSKDTILIYEFRVVYEWQLK